MTFSRRSPDRSTHQFQKSKRSQSGIVLVIVLFFAVLLTASIATFVRRAVIDAKIIKNRDQAAQAEALARGGIRLAEALILEDLLEDENRGEDGLETNADIWARMNGNPIEMEDGGVLLLQIEDASARVNLNALFTDEVVDNPGDSIISQFLAEFLRQVVADMPGRQEEKFYDVEDLAWNLIDYIDINESRDQHGGSENDSYQREDPPYKAANRPLLSVDELRMVEGFDARLVNAMKPYVTVYPYAIHDDTNRGINPNTAPAWVLRMLYYRDSVSEYRLVDSDIVKDLVEARAEGVRLCPNAEGDCMTLREVNGNLGNDIFPPPSFYSDVFLVRAEATVGEITRTIEAVIDRAEPSELLLLSWRVR